MNGEFWHGDCLELMARIPSGSVDMVLCDLPYGTTQNKWDTVIPFELLWKEYWRVCKPNAAIVLTAAQPFTSALVMSQINTFKYDWSWNKKLTTGHLNAKNRPMRQHEDILIFSKDKTVYNPIKTFGKPNKKPTTTIGADKVRNGFGKHKNVSSDYGIEKFPTSIIEIEKTHSKYVIHPTQKPVALFEYLIRTYTNPGETVLDNCAGSGTTAIAAERTGRRWICIEKDFTYWAGAYARVYAECNK